MNKKKLNVIWFLVDAVRTYRTGLDDRDKLDLMDKMAEESVAFTSAVTSVASSIMSVAAMMTSCPAYQIARDYDGLFCQSCSMHAGSSSYENRLCFLNIFSLLSRNL